MYWRYIYSHSFFLSFELWFQHVVYTTAQFKRNLEPGEHDWNEHKSQNIIWFIFIWWRYSVCNRADRFRHSLFCDGIKLSGFSCRNQKFKWKRKIFMRKERRRSERETENKWGLIISHRQYSCHQIEVNVSALIFILSSSSASAHNTSNSINHDA